MKSPSAPATPNFSALADNQAKLNTNALIANRYDQVNPYGSQTWMRTQVTGADGKPTDSWQLRTNLSNDQQQLFDQGMGARKALASSAPQYAQMLAGVLSSPIDNGTAVRDRVEADLLGKLNRQSDMDLESLRSRLLNQGITENSEAWRRAMNDFDQNRQNARSAALLNAGDAASQQASLDAGVRGQYLNELASILSQSSATIPNYYAPQGMATAPDQYGAAQDQYAAALQNYNAKVANQGQLIGALGSLGGATLMGAGSAGGFSKLFG